MGTEGIQVDMEYIVNFTINSTKDYKPITISCRLSEYQARVLMKTPVESINISVQRHGGAGGMLIDSLPEPVLFGDGGAKPK